MILLINARKILAAVRRRPKGYGVTSRRLQHSPAHAGQNVYTLLRRPFGPMQREGAKATERGEAKLLAQLLPFPSKNCDGSGAEGRRASRDAVSGVTAFLWARRGRVI